MTVKSLFATASLFGAALVPATVATPAIAEANPYVEVCKVETSNPLFSNYSQGECVSLNVLAQRVFEGGGNEQAFAVHLCDYFEENDPALYALFGGTKKSCITAVKQIF